DDDPAGALGPEPGTSPWHDVGQDASTDGTGQAGGRDGRTTGERGHGQVSAPHCASPARPQPPGPRGSLGQRLPIRGSDRVPRPPEVVPPAAQEAGKPA